MNKLWMALALVIVLGTISCTSNDLDSSGSADVIMLIQNLDTPQITANRQTATSGTCSNDPNVICSAGGTECGLGACVLPFVCILQVEEWTASIEAAPKNTLAVPPFNNIVMQDVTITYEWTNPLINAEPGLQGPYTAGLGNVTIPAEGTNSVTFIPIPSDLLNRTLPGGQTLEGATGTLSMRFRGITVEGTQITQTATTNLVVQICT
jgi:hypothetical protein